VKYLRIGVVNSDVNSGPLYWSTQQSPVRGSVVCSQCSVIITVVVFLRYKNSLCCLVESQCSARQHSAYWTELTRSAESVYK